MNDATAICMVMVAVGLLIFAGCMAIKEGLCLVAAAIHSLSGNCVYIANAIRERK